MMRFPKNLIVTSMALSAMLASPMVFAGVVKTEILKVEKMSAPNGVYQVLSTADGRVYSADPADQKLVDQLKAHAAKRTPVNLIIADDDVVGVSPMSASEARVYSDPVSAMPTSQLLNESTGASRKSDEDETTLADDAPEATDGEEQTPPSIDPAAATAPGALPAAPVVTAPVTAPTISGMTKLDASDNSTPAPVATTPAAILEFRKYGYEPTIFNSMSEAHRLFESERNLDHGSQCHQRAMVWTHDMYTREGIKSMKVMMFYTELFRNTFVRKTSNWLTGDSVKPYKWWYHTAPFVYVGNQEIILDREFVEHEMPLDDWTNFFLADEAIHYSNVYARELNRQETHCRVMSRYQEYDNQTGQDWCLVRKFPMYYMQPASIEALDCDPTRESAPGRPNQLLPNGLPKYPCFHQVLTDFDKWSVENAYGGATDRHPDRGTGR
jgi:hypothetical protein